MADSDRSKWNAIYGARVTGPGAPSEFVRAFESILPPTGRAIDVAGGTGRHALWLARRGLDVTLADVSEVALAQARESAAQNGLALHTECVDLECRELPRGPWDVIVCVDFLWRPLYRAFANHLNSGGLLVIAHPTRENLLRHPRPGPRHLLDPGELTGLVGDLDILHHEEGWAENGRHEARLVARRNALEDARPVGERG